MIPDHNSIMLPLLKLVSDKREHESKDIKDLLATLFKISEEERKERYPRSGRLILDDRIYWAKTYLKNAGLIEYPKRSFVVITPHGLDVIGQNLQKIDTSCLRQYHLSQATEFKTTKQDLSKV